MVRVIRLVVVVMGLQLASSEICVVGVVVFGQAAGVYRFDVVLRSTCAVAACSARKRCVY